MNIRNLAKEWLKEHNLNEKEPSFEKYTQDLVDLIEIVLDASDRGSYIGDADGYDYSVGENTLCLCGHTYYRHFDTYDGMSPVGCKYCWHCDDYDKNHCAGFKKKE